MKTFLLVVILLAASRSSFGSHTFTLKERAVLDAWLKTHQGYRLAEDKDCDCEDDLYAMRTQSEGVWKAIPDYHPYRVSGDFNGDGVVDLAVVVVDTKAAHDFSLLVFNGPLDPDHPVPAFANTHRDLAHVGLFYGPPRPKPYRLVIGPFESEGLILEPHGNTYRLHE